MLWKRWSKGNPFEWLKVLSNFQIIRSLSISVENNFQSLEVTSPFVSILSISSTDSSTERQKAETARRYQRNRSTTCELKSSSSARFLPIFAMLAKKIHMPMTNGVSTRWNSTEMTLYSGFRCSTAPSIAWFDVRCSMELAPLPCSEARLRNDTSGREPSIGPIGPKLLPGYGSLRSRGNSWSSTIGPWIA